MYLNCHSYFSFKYGAIPLKDLLQEAQLRQIPKLALTDINNSAGCIDFIRLAPKHNIEPAVGIDFRFKNNKRWFTAIAINNEGYFELNRFLSAFLLNQKIQPAPAFNNSFVIYPLQASPPKKLRENEFIGVELSDLTTLSFKPPPYPKSKLVALHSATFRSKADFNAHRLLRAIDQNCLLSRLSADQQGKETDLLLNEQQLMDQYKLHPFLIENAQKLLSQCSIGFDFAEVKNKKTFYGSTQEDLDKLRELCAEGLIRRYGKVDEVLEERMDRELNLIVNQGFAAYFLINWDMVNYAKSQGYFYVGRGSGANSLVAYCLEITNVDPIGLDLYFERFINEFRKNPPDFDIDFSWKDREDVRTYLFDKHGRDHVALLGAYNTFQSRAVIRELGKVFGLPKAEIDALVGSRKGMTVEDNITQLIIKYGNMITDFPNHLSIHSGGVIISDKPIHCYTATEVPPKGFATTQFSMLEAEDIGLYKFDVLSQRGLGHIRDAVDIVKENQGVEIDINRIDDFKKDEKIKDLLRSGRTMGCFYVESPAMRMLLKKLGCDDYLTLVAASSIIRPGVAQSGMMREYIQRYRKPETRQYIHPKMQELMEETFGVMVYQEDVIKVAHHFAGMSLSEADVLRRGMSGKFRGRDEFDKAKDKFIEGCKKKGYPDAITFEVWRQVESFAGYSFSKGHSASYAVESYQSLYLKAHYPLEFMVGVINNFGGFYRTEMYIHEARMNGANIQAPCVNTSDYVTCIKGKDIYLGLIHLKDFEQKAAEAILHERTVNGKFKSLENFMKRVSLEVEQIRILIRIGAFRFTGRTKKELLWEMFSLLGSKKKTEARAELFEVASESFELPALHYNQLEDAYHEIEILGFPLCSPFDLLETAPTTKYTAEDLSKYIGKTIEITGYLVTIKFTRTVRGEEMNFATFIDKDGYFFDTTHFPPVLKTHPFRGMGCYTIKGKVADEFDYPSIEVVSMEKMPIKGRQ